MISDDLMREYRQALAAEDQRLQSLETIRISPWNPRNTMRWDQERCKRRVQDLTRWAEDWWHQHGCKVVWRNDAARHQLPACTVETIP